MKDSNLRNQELSQLQLRVILYFIIFFYVFFFSLYFFFFFFFVAPIELPQLESHNKCFKFLDDGNSN